jgi:hypothetical protein
MLAFHSFLALTLPTLYKWINPPDDRNKDGRKLPGDERGLENKTLQPIFSTPGTIKYF